MSEKPCCLVCGKEMSAEVIRFGMACANVSCIMYALGKDRQTQVEKVAESARRATREEIAQLVANVGYHDLAEEIRKMAIIAEK